MNKDERLSAIEKALHQAFPGAKIVVTDESAAHVGHAGAASGAGHFAVLVVSPTFLNQTLIQRHQRIYEALAPLMRKPTAIGVAPRSSSLEPEGEGFIHALQITAMPHEH